VVGAVPPIERWSVMHRGTLVELTTQRAKLDPALTIYAAEPWTPSTRAVATVEPDDGSLPEAAMVEGCQYFLEVFIANEVLEGWDGSELDACHRLIQYVANDA
jgi:hypothetical protein